MGLTVLDAGVLIGFLDANDEHHGAASRELAAALDRTDRLAVPASALAETLVGPSRRGPAQIDIVMQLLDRLPIGVVDLDTAVALAAAALRASHRSLRLPDALVIATAQVSGADRLITTDRKWPTRAKLRLGAQIVKL